jgi:hypothetical protein
VQDRELSYAPAIIKKGYRGLHEQEPLNETQKMQKMSVRKGANEAANQAG